VLSGDKARVKGRGSREKPTGGPLDDFFLEIPKSMMLSGLIKIQGSKSLKTIQIFSTSFLVFFLENRGCCIPH
jgi:hypothetical protein